MLATATVTLKSLAPRIGFALRETRDRLIPGKLLLRELMAQEISLGSSPDIASNDGAHLVASETTARRDILAAQRLRYRVFTEEYGAQFDGMAGIDSDRFDRHCRHIVVKDANNGQVIAYTRLLTEDRARKAGGWYSGGEFDLGMVERLDGRALEIGRTCVHPDYRSGAAIGVLWSKIGEILVAEGFTWLFGCASVPLAEKGAAAMLSDMRSRAVANTDFAVTPRLALPDLLRENDAPVKLPALLRTYLSMGARVCGAPCWDPDFNCADVFILVDVRRISPRYIRHFMGKAPGHRAEMAA